MVHVNDIKQAYFDWMCDIVCGERFAKSVSYKKLLRCLHDIEFTYSIRNDSNRAEDGLSLRYRFAYIHGCAWADTYLDGPCSVLEMLVALAIHCEEDIMDDPQLGDRTGQWFWGMINNLGLGSMTDYMFDRPYVNEVITRFLNREYSPNGKGGLFTVRNCNVDLRTVEIQYQLNWYLNSIT